MNNPQTIKPSSYKAEKKQSEDFLNVCTNVEDGVAQCRKAMLIASSDISVHEKRINDDVVVVVVYVVLCEFYAAANLTAPKVSQGFFRLLIFLTLSRMNLQGRGTLSGFSSESIMKSIPKKILQIVQLMKNSERST